MKIAIFGSAFNPPTRGHEDAIRYVLENIENIGQVLLVPSFRHAFAKQMSDYDTRLTLLDAFVQDLDDDRVRTCAIEHLIAEPGKPVFTYDLLTHLQQEIGEYDELCFVMGPDNAKNWDSFYHADKIKQQWRLITVPERKAIRSTLVRQGLKDGKDVSELLTPSVNTLLKSNPVYA